MRCKELWAPEELRYGCFAERSTQSRDSVQCAAHGSCGSTELGSRRSEEGLPREPLPRHPGLTQKEVLSSGLVFEEVEDQARCRRAFEAAEREGGDP